MEKMIRIGYRIAVHTAILVIALILWASFVEIFFDVSDPGQMAFVGCVAFATGLIGIVMEAIEYYE